MIGLGILAAVTVAFIATGAILHATYFEGKRTKLQPYGEIVNVYDGTMHVCSMGSGGSTVVLLPGMGVALPSAEFAPLMRKLSETRTAVCVEYFGVGFSGSTSRPRTSANYVEEIRAALAAAGFKPPYALMAHSISSLYAEHYAAMYPDEVSAIISLDGTSSAYYEEMPAAVKALLPVAKVQQALGTTSLLAALTANRSKLASQGFTDREIDDMTVMAGFSMNATMLEQIRNSAEFIRQTMELPYPESVPYFKVIARQTYEKPNPQLAKAGMTPRQYQERHLERIGAQARFEILDGSHFIYLNNAEAIARIADQVLD